MRNRDSEGHTDSAVKDSARAPLLSRRRVHKTLSLKSLSWIAVLTERALSTRSSAALRQQRRGSPVPEAQRADRALEGDLYKSARLIGGHVSAFKGTRHHSRGIGPLKRRARHKTPTVLRPSSALALGCRSAAERALPLSACRARAPQLWLFNSKSYVDKLWP